MIYDLSLTLDAALPFFEGDPPFSLTPAITVEEAGYAVSALRMGTHGGTHIDVPRHVFVDGQTVDAAPIDSFVGEAAVLGAKVASGYAALDDASLAELSSGDIALIHTGWDENFSTPDYLRSYPAFRREDMQRLIDIGVKAVGTDLPSFETDLSCEIHRLLLGAGVVLIESLTSLSPLVGKRCFFAAAPLKLLGGDGSPVRAFAVI